MSSCQIPQTLVRHLQVASVRTESWDATFLRVLVVYSRRMLAGTGYLDTEGGKKPHTSFLHADRDNGTGWLPRSQRGAQEPQEEAWPHGAQAFLFAWLWGQGIRGLFI